jgi:hypothetical protein
MHPEDSVGLRKDVPHKGDTLYLIYKAAIPNTHHSWRGDKGPLLTQLLIAAREGLKSV